MRAILTGEFADSCLSNANAYRDSLMSGLFRRAIASSLSRKTLIPFVTTHSATPFPFQLHNGWLRGLRNTWTFSESAKAERRESRCLV